MKKMIYRKDGLYLLRDQSGAFLFEDYNPESDSVVMRSQATGARVETKDDNVMPFADCHMEKIRQEMLADTPVNAIESYDIRPWSDEAEQIARSRERIMIKFIEGDYSLEDAMAKFELKPVMIRKLRRKYLADRSWKIFLPGKSGRMKGDTRFASAVEETIVKYSVDYTGPGANEERVIDSVIAECHGNGQRPPSRSTIRRRLKSILSERERIAVKEGAEAAKDKMGSYPFKMVTTAPLEVVEADVSPCDIHVKCRHTGKSLGRPHLLLIKDKFTRCILAFVIFFGAPSRWLLAQAIDMAIRPKDELLEKLGLVGWKWVQYGRFQTLLVDGGRDLNANTVKAACERNGVQHLRRKRKQSGGSIERALGITNRYFIQTLEGSVPSSGKKPRQKVKHTLYLDQVTKVVTQEIIRRNEKVGTDGLTNNDRWNNYWGVHDGEVRSPPRFEDPTRFVIDMYHESRVIVRKDCILTHGLSFQLDPSWNMTGEHVRVKLDHSNIDNAWVELNDRWVPIERIGPDIDHLRLYNGGPITMQVWKIHRAVNQKAGTLTAQGEFYHQEQRKTLDQIRKEEFEQGRRRANDQQNKLIGAFPQTNMAISKKGAAIDGSNHDDDVDDVDLLKGVFR